MRLRFSFGLFGLVVATMLSSTSPVVAQGVDDAEEQALEILRLYEQGRTDTAYWLIEPLKKHARFVPAALFVRAQMTPDDRALNLYREVIALEPGGAWADDAAFQLVRRYVAKRDSIGASSWLTMLSRTFPQTPFLSQARSLVASQSVWSFREEERRAEDRDAADPDARSLEEPEVAVEVEVEADVAEMNDQPDRFSGYALQVGLLPTEVAADRHAAAMLAAGLTPHVFEKGVDGRNAWAVVVGPYPSKDEAAADKPRVVNACGCGAFTVIVE